MMSLNFKEKPFYYSVINIHVQHKDILLGWADKCPFVQLIGDLGLLGNTQPEFV